MPILRGVSSTESITSSYRSHKWVCQPRGVWRSEWSFNGKWRSQPGSVIGWNAGWRHHVVSYCCAQAVVQGAKILKMLSAVRRSFVTILLKHKVFSTRNVFSTGFVTQSMEHVWSNPKFVGSNFTLGRVFLGPSLFGPNLTSANAQIDVWVFSTVIYSLINYFMNSSVTKRVEEWVLNAPIKRSQSMLGSAD